MKKLISLLLVTLLLTALFVGCAKSADTPASDAPASEAPTEPAASYDRYFLFNGVEVAPGVKYAEIKDALGAEIKPADDILPCDGSDLYHNVQHYHDGLTVVETKDGVISEIYVEEGSAALFMGKLGLGASPEDAIAQLGEPRNWPLAEDDYSLDYGTESAWVNLFLDPDSNKTVIYSMSMLSLGDMTP